MCRALHDDRGPSGGASHPTGIASVLALLTLLACSDGHRLDVAAPVGDREQDRSAIVVALEHAAPGAVIHLGAGTYVVGGERIVVGTPAVTMRGHPDGTTLVGCTSDERADMSEEDFWNECNGFALAGEAQRVSGIRFEGFNYALRIEHPRAAGLPERDVPFLGGHVIEDNVFQDVSTFSINLDADSVVQIRNNEFRNTWHAVAVGGSNIEIVDNDISVPEPERVSNGYPGGAIGIRPDDGVCEDILVEGNHIDGHTEAVMVALFPQDEPGSSCSDITVKGNVISMRPVLLPEDDPRFSSQEAAARAGKLSIAPPILIRNVQRLVAVGDIEWPASWIPEGGWPPELARGRIHDVVIEGNRISGAVGVGIEVVDADDVHIIDNEIDVRPASSPAEIDGLYLGGNGGPGVWVELGLLETVNGSPVWVSAGSQRVTVRAPE